MRCGSCEGMETNDVSYRRVSYGRGRERIAALVLLALCILVSLALYGLVHLAYGQWGGGHALLLV